MKSIFRIILAAGPTMLLVSAVVGVIWLAIDITTKPVPLTIATLPVTNLSVLGTRAIVFPNESGTVGNYTFHAPADYGIGVSLPAIAKLEEKWGVPNVTDFYFAEPVAGAHLYEISEDESAVTLYGSDVGDVIANFGLVVYWCNNASIPISEETCSEVAQGLVYSWWPNNFHGMGVVGVIPAIRLLEPPISLIPTRDPAYGTVTAPTPAGP